MEKGILKALAAVAVFGFLLVQASIHWDWSFYMDDISAVMANAKRPLGFLDLPFEVIQIIRGDWITAPSLGRFSPAYNTLNFLRWQVWPRDPVLYHWICVAFLAVLIVLGAKVYRRLFDGARFTTGELVLYLALFVILQRPVLDIAALITIPETYVLLFTLIGFTGYPHKPWFYRILFLLAALSKEPGVVAFFAAGMARLTWVAVSKKRDSKQIAIAVIDLILFGILIGAVMWMVRSGSYLSSYRLISVLAFQKVAIGLVKAAIGLLPLVFVMTRTKGFLLKDHASLIFWTLFGASYLYLAAARSPVGYLILPGAFAFALVAGAGVLETLNTVKFTRSRQIFAVTLFVGVLASSLVRFERFGRAISDGAGVQKVLGSGSQPPLVVVQGAEQETVLGRYYQWVGSSAQTAGLWDGDLEYRIRDFKGDIALFEATSYFGAVPEEQLEMMQRTLGQAPTVVERGSFRVRVWRKLKQGDVL